MNYQFLLISRYLTEPGQILTVSFGVSWLLLYPWVCVSIAPSKHHGDHSLCVWKGLSFQRVFWEHLGQLNPTALPHTLENQLSRNVPSGIKSKLHESFEFTHIDGFSLLLNLIWCLCFGSRMKWTSLLLTVCLILTLDCTSRVEGVLALFSVMLKSLQWRDHFQADCGDSCPTLNILKTLFFCDALGMGELYSM